MPMVVSSIPARVPTACKSSRVWPHVCNMLASKDEWLTLEENYQGSYPAFWDTRPFAFVLRDASHACIGRMKLPGLAAMVRDFQHMLQSNPWEARQSYIARRILTECVLHVAQSYLHNRYKILIDKAQFRSSAQFRHGLLAELTSVIA